MTAKISYRTPLPEGHHAPSEAPRDPWARVMIEEAAAIARRVLDLAGIPHHLERQDHRRDPAHAAQPLYGHYLRLSGDATMCQPLKYGWIYDPGQQWTVAEGDGPEQPSWSGLHSCITQQARDFPKTHIVLSEIIRRWEAAGLADQVRDSTGWHVGMQPRRLSAVHGVTTTSLKGHITWMQETLGKGQE